MPFEPTVSQRLIAPTGTAFRSCPHGGAFFEAVGAEFDDLNRRRVVINADVLDAWFPPAPSVLTALAEQLPWILRTSPPTLCDGLIRVIARVRDVPPECILPGAGSSDLIFLALRTWLTATSRVLLLDPTYGEYAHVCESVIGCAADRFRLDRRDGYEANLAALKSRLNDGYDLVILVNPNNPTGRHAPRAALEELLRNVPARTRCWVDEAYADYAGADQSLEQFASSSTNVVVCKSLSKGLALSGVRAAYLVAGGQVLDELRRLTPPWAVSLPAQIAAVRALQEPAYYARQYVRTDELRAELVCGIRRVAPGADVISGVGNFVLLHLPSDGPSAGEVVRRCRGRGLYVRDAGGMGRELGTHALRLAVKDAGTQQQMLEVLAWALDAEPGAAEDVGGVSAFGDS